MSDRDNIDGKYPLSVLENPPSVVLDAMAEERRRQEGKNGHGKWGYRDLWLAGVAALKAAQP